MSLRCGLGHRNHFLDVQRHSVVIRHRLGPGFVDQLRHTLSGYRNGRTTVVLHGYHNKLAQADLELGEAWRVEAIPELLRAVRAVPGVQAAKLRIVREQTGGGRGD